MSSPSPDSEAAVGRRFAITHEVVLATVLVVEIAVFAAIGRNFLTWSNAFQITRLLVEGGGQIAASLLGNVVASAKLCP